MLDTVVPVTVEVGELAELDDVESCEVVVDGPIVTTLAPHIPSFSSGSPISYFK